MKKFLQEFKAFINKGNVLDMAIGVVIATAFGKIPSSLVADVIMPLISLATGAQSLADLRITLKPDIINEAGETVAGTYINYGVFLQAILDFILIAFVIFLVVRAIAKAKEKAEARKKKAEEAAEEEKPAEPSAEEKLLTEIRDLLKEKK